VVGPFLATKLEATDLQLSVYAIREAVSVWVEPQPTEKLASIPKRDIFGGQMLKCTLNHGVIACHGEIEFYMY